MKYVTDILRTQLEANPNALDGQLLRMVLFRNAPGTDAVEAYPYPSVPTIKKLLDGNFPGWELVTATETYTSPVPAVTEVLPNTTPNGTTAYIRFESFHMEGLLQKVGASAIGIEICGVGGADIDLWGEINPLVLVSDEMFPHGRVVLDKDDILTALNDPDLVDQGNQRWLLSWLSTVDGVTVTPEELGSSITIGDLAILLGPPDYKPSHHFDVWMYPQRVNMIANPSFEAIENKFWATNGVFSRVRSPVDSGFAGQFDGESIAIESNTFPIDRGDGLWTVQMLVKGSGLLSVGLVSWPEAYDYTGCDWGEERWQLHPDTVLHISVLRKCYEAAEGMLCIRIEGGSSVILDKVLCEEGTLIDWPYFDGDSQYAATDDYSWYGERGASYSCWYNNRRSTVSRLFLQPTYTGMTSTEKEPHGLVYDWVPAGTIVDFHLDVLRPEDLKTPPREKDGVMPDDITDPDFGIPGGSLNVLTPESALVFTPDSEEVFVAHAPTEEVPDAEEDQ